MRRLGYQNAALTAIAILLALGIVDRQGSPTLQPSAAYAQPGADGGLSNALEQRKAMIAELRAMNARLERIESKFATMVDVRVKDMPPVKFPPEVMRRLEGLPPQSAPGAATASISVTPGEGK